MSPKLFRQERQDRIIELLETQKRVSVAALSERFGLSQATVRSDLGALLREGLIVRTHGGAILAESDGIEMSFRLRRQLHSAEKERIGAAAAAMIEDGEAIALDASTTALAIAVQIRDRRELTVVTNGIYIALALIDRPGVTVFMPGGFLRRDSVSMVGGDGRELIQSYHVQRGFFGAKGLTLREGLTDVNCDEVAIKRDMVRHAKQVIAVVDSSKWGRVGFVSFASVDEIATVITDAGAPHDMVDALEDAGIAVIIADRP
jgi:DeoR family transcriptional regulator of aga operon/DeoR family fructose operon transcriptional repressor